MTSRKIATFAIGPIGGALLGLITLSIITWLFSQQDVGCMAMLQVTLNFSVLLLSLGLDQSYVREFHNAENKPVLLKIAMLPGLLLLERLRSCKAYSLPFVLHLLLELRVYKWASTGQRLENVHSRGVRFFMRFL